MGWGRLLAKCIGSRGDRQLHDLALDRAPGDAEAADGDREAEAARAGAAGVEPEHAVRALAAGAVGVAGDHRGEAGGGGSLGEAAPDLARVVEQEQRQAAGLDGGDLGEALGPGAVIVVAADRDERGPDGERFEHLGAADVARVQQPVAAGEGGEGFGAEQAVRVADHAEHDRAIALVHAGSTTEVASRTKAPRRARTRSGISWPPGKGSHSTARPAARRRSRRRSAPSIGSSSSRAPWLWSTGRPRREGMRGVQSSSAIRVAESSTRPARGRGSWRATSQASIAPCEKPPSTSDEGARRRATSSRNSLTWARAAARPSGSSRARSRRGSRKASRSSGHQAREPPP